MAPECEPCELRTICHGLVRGRTYRVISVRDKDHPCAVHLDDKAVVVEIVEESVEASVPARKALEGAIVTLEGSECPVKWCSNHHLCTRTYLQQGEKVLIVTVADELECPLGLKLRKVTVERREE
jgi:uncharacterized protein (UPF0179 family)